MRPSTFFIGMEGRQLRYETNQYNASRTNERAVEIPIALEWLSRHPGHLLEVGNVLRHYRPEMRHQVVDRYEVEGGVTNVDILDFVGPVAYDAIVCISTIEHVGWDDTPRDVRKAGLAINHMRRLLSPTGRLLLSFPLGHHDGLDLILANHAFEADPEVLMVRTDKPKRRTPGTWVAALNLGQQVPYLHHAWSAGAVWFGEFGHLPPSA